MISRRSVQAAVLVLATLAATIALATSPADAASGKVRATVVAQTGLWLRASTTGKSKAVRKYKNRTAVAVICLTPGQRVKGTVRTTTMWAKLATGRYVSYAYLRPARAIRSCSTSRAATTYAGAVNSSDGPVRLRTGPSTQFAIVTTVPDGTRLTFSCTANGETITGTNGTSSRWDRTTDNRWISHAYATAPAMPTCATAPRAPRQLSNSEFVAMSVPGAQQGWREYGVPPSVTIGQAILESGWGRSSLSATDNNYFGIKCFDGVHGPLANGCHSYVTSECTKAGSCYTTTATFRTYASATNSFRDHGRFLKVNSRYAPAFKYTRNANAFLQAIWKAGYATDPNYVSKVKALMSSYNLYQYDTYK